MKTKAEAAQELRQEFEIKYGSGSNLNSQDVAICIEQTFIEGINHAQQWISVNDELPECSDIVLVKTDKGGVSIARRYGNKIEFIFDFGDVTHWRPIELK